MQIQISCISGFSRTRVNYMKWLYTAFLQKENNNWKENKPNFFLFFFFWKKCFKKVNCPVLQICFTLQGLTGSWEWCFHFIGSCRKINLHFSSVWIYLCYTSTTVNVQKICPVKWHIVGWSQGCSKSDSCFSQYLISSRWSSYEDYNISFCKKWKFRCHCSYEQWHLNFHCLQRGQSCL